MIRDIEVSSDAAGFPVVTWTEARGFSSVEGPGTARIECRIMKEARNGVLLFVARGPVRNGAFEEGKPWEALRSFSVHAAERLYYGRAEQQARQHMAGKGLGSKLLWGDGGQVLVAEFAGDSPMHINDADASPVDVERLHVVLTREFVGRQQDLVSRLCADMFLWPISDPRVVTYDPQRQRPNSSAQPRALGKLFDLAGNLTMALLTIGFASFLFGLVLMLLGVV